LPLLPQFPSILPKRKKLSVRGKIGGDSKSNDLVLREQHTWKTIPNDPVPTTRSAM